MATENFNRHGHPATAKAVELYDDRNEDGTLRDLEPFEQTFLTAVHNINMLRARTAGDAARAWGFGSRAYDATVYLADRQQEADLTAALEAYQAAVDADDEVLEAEMLEAAE